MPKSKAVSKPVEQKELISLQEGDQDLNIKNVQEKYQVKSQQQHILDRPDTYVGGMVCEPQEHWVLENNDSIKLQTINIVPALYKLFDELIVNSIDHWRNDPSMDELSVDISQDEISVYNSGCGIPIVLHQQASQQIGKDIYVPTLLFGYLLTSTNYDDQQQKLTGGRNGLGAKLSNIFSKQFTVETCDGKHSFVQVFRNNNSEQEEAHIHKVQPGAKQYTKIIFKPDFQRFGLKQLDHDNIALMKRRLFDASAVFGGQVKVILNGKKLPQKDFLGYLSCVFTDDSVKPVTFINDQWKIGIWPTTKAGQLSIVNGVYTSIGGAHIDCVVNQLANFALADPQLQKSVSQFGPRQLCNAIRSSTCIVMVGTVPNPKFESQLKRKLEIPISNFGTSLTLPTDTMRCVYDDGLAELVDDYLRCRQKTNRRVSLKGIDKLVDAKHAGSQYSWKCSLIITEGDSAKALALAGLQGIDQEERNIYGVYPVSGKVLNVRGASSSQIKGNEAVQALTRILGLKTGAVYDEQSISSLRYGHVMFMTDQDHDGHHIKGLILNFFHAFWPSLFDIPDFFQVFSTPIVKAKYRKQEKAFFSQQQYSAWRSAMGSGVSGWTVKYYKGLGTSSDSEGRSYFKEMNQHVTTVDQIAQSTHQLMTLLFQQDGAQNRRSWMNWASQINYHQQNNQQQLSDGIDKLTDVGSMDDKNAEKQWQQINLWDFLNNDFYMFTEYSVQRTIPSVIDGFKLSQRKVLFGLLRWNQQNGGKAGKVNVVVGDIISCTAYHHSESSLQDCIIAMAQTFVGSNNVNFLEPVGQFGSRRQMGADAAAARYISTKLSRWVPYLFKQQDSCLLVQQEEDDMSVQPDWYAPILPMVLVNGGSGIGTGYSFSLPAYNPLHLIEAIQDMMEDRQPRELLPWYRGFNGIISMNKQNSQRIIIQGQILLKKDGLLVIKEIPIKMSTEQYEDKLAQLLEKGVISYYRNECLDSKVKYVVQLSPEAWAAALYKAKNVTQVRSRLIKQLCLEQSVQLGNIHLLDASGHVRKYNTVQDILKEYYTLRLQLYQYRLDAQVQRLECERQSLSNKLRFGEQQNIQYLQKASVDKASKTSVEHELKQQGYVCHASSNKLHQQVRTHLELNDSASQQVQTKSNLIQAGAQRSSYDDEYSIYQQEVERRQLVDDWTDGDSFSVAQGGNAVNISFDNYIDHTIKAKHGVQTQHADPSDEIDSEVNSQESSDKLIEPRGASTEAIKHELSSNSRCDKVVSVLGLSGAYDYVLQTKIRQTLKDQADQMQSRIKSIDDQIKLLQQQSPKQLWLEELLQFKRVYSSQVAQPSKKTNSQIAAENKNRSAQSQRDPKQSTQPQKQVAAVSGAMMKQSSRQSRAMCHINHQHYSPFMGTLFNAQKRTGTLKPRRVFTRLKGFNVSLC